MSMYGGCDQNRYAYPGLRELAWWERNLFIEEPDHLVKHAAEMLSSAQWEDIVVALALLTGRCLPEVLKTGVLWPKKRYSLLYSAYQEQTDAVLGPFELPTLVEAEWVLVAWQRVRSLLDCVDLAASEICARYRTSVCQRAEHQFAQSVPVNEHKDWYAPLYLRVYPLIATRYYCPIDKKPRWFQEVIRGLTWPRPSYEGACKPHCQECMRSCSFYVVGDGVNNIDGVQGIKLKQVGVEPLECTQSLEEEAFLDDGTTFEWDEEEEQGRF
jgi:hypothetical protein